MSETHRDQAPRRAGGYTPADGLRDGCALAGTGLLAYGAWLVYPPAGFIAPGAILIALSVLAAWPRRGA